MPDENHVNRLLLREGMRSGDLKDLVLPTISVDEYQSKLESDDGAVVFGFYVQDIDAAKDLNRFIQKSPVPILDSEVSEAPDAHGFYMVFVDIENNDRTAPEFTALLAEIEPLTDINEWSVHARGNNGVREFSEEYLRSILKKNVAATVSENTAALAEFLRESALQDASLTDRQIRLLGSDSEVVTQIIDFGIYEDVIPRLGLHKKAIDIDFNSSATCHHYERLLGEGWNVYSSDGQFVVRRFGSDYCLVLKAAP